MILIRKAASAAMLLIALFVAGCGDTFRPIVIPITQPGGDPQTNRSAIVLSSNGPANLGATTHINVSGDTNVGQVTTGLNPLHATVVGNNRVVVANAGDSTLSIYAAFSPTLSPAGIITLPAGSAPNYVFTSNTTTLYVSFPGLNSLGLVDLNLSVFAGQIVVGLNPVAIVGNASRVYVANQGSGTVSVISTATNLVTQTVTVGGAPVFLAMNADGNRVYAVNQNGTVAVIDATIDAPGAAPAATLTVGSQPNFAIFDPRLLRVYVSNPGSNSVSIINADPLSAGFNSVTNVTVDAAPKSIAPLPDGTRAYVADSGAGTVNIINTLNNTVIRKITVGTTPVSIVASADSTKVFVANQGSNTVSVIRTSDDTVVATILAPLQDPTCNPAVSQCARMSPILALTTP